MKVKNKKVYYCDFCGKHRLTINSIENHEKHCTLNPNRECGMCGEKANYKKEIEFVNRNYKILISKRDKKTYGIEGTYCENFRNKIKKLKERIDCPACVLSILRQSKIDNVYFEYDYKEEAEKWWQEKREEEERNEYY